MASENIQLNRVIAPSITTARRNGITPALGDLVYDSDDNNIYIGAAGENANDPNRWVLVTIDQFQGATATEDGFFGYVPEPVGGQQETLLRGDGTWANVTYAAESAMNANDGVDGLVPSADFGERNEFFRGDGTWNPLPTFSAESALNADDETSGIVPGPSFNQRNSFLRGDGTWRNIFNYVQFQNSANIPFTGANSSTTERDDPLASMGVTNSSNTDVSINATGTMTVATTGTYEISATFRYEFSDTDTSSRITARLRMRSGGTDVVTTPYGYTRSAAPQGGAGGSVTSIETLSSGTNYIWEIVNLSETAEGRIVPPSGVTIIVKRLG